MESPRVFISYSHDSPEHRARVLALSDRLRDGGLDGMGGIDCLIDQYEMAPDIGWPTWCDRQIEKSKFVLVVCTPTYLKRFKKEEQPGTGLGVTFEGHVITQELYNGQGRNTKFIPIVFDPQDRASVPVTLQGAGTLVLLGEYEALYRRLTNQPAVEKPGLTAVKKLPPLAALSNKNLQIAPHWPENPARLCDRTKAVSHFKGKIQTSFASSAPPPVVCIAHAMTYHRPDSLVQRLIDELQSAREGGSTVKDVPWEQDFSEADIRRELSGILLRDWNGDPIPAPKFAERLKDSLGATGVRNPIVIRHSINGWSNKTSSVLRDYLRFWHDWPAIEGGPKIFAFFVIEHRSMASWLGRAKWRRELSSNTLGQSSLILDSFEWINDQHVRELIRELGWAPPGAKRDRLVARILGGRLRRAVGLQVRRSMTYVEQKLNEISGDL